MEEREYEPAFQTISFAGAAKSEAALAVQCAKAGDMAGAQEHMKQAKQYILCAHDLQTGMITQEAHGNPVAVNIILVHAQDHLAMALMAIDNAEEFIEIYAKLQKYEKGD